MATGRRYHCRQRRRPGLHLYALATAYLRVAGSSRDPPQNRLSYGAIGARMSGPPASSTRRWGRLRGGRRSSRWVRNGRGGRTALAGSPALEPERLQALSEMVAVAGGTAAAALLRGVYGH